MAFSTQKDFMKVDFLTDRRPREEVGKRCRVSLKTYSSCTDSRAWSLSRESQAKYLQDMVSCGMRLSSQGGGDGSEEDLLDGSRTGAPSGSRTGEASGFAGKPIRPTDGTDDIASMGRRKVPGDLNAGTGSHSGAFSGGVSGGDIHSRSANGNIAHISGGSGGGKRVQGIHSHSGRGGVDSEGSGEFGPESAWTGHVTGGPDNSEVKDNPPGPGASRPIGVARPMISLPSKGAKLRSGSRVVVVAPVASIRHDRDDKIDGFLGETSDEDLDKEKAANSSEGIGGEYMHSGITGGKASLASASAPPGLRPVLGLSGDSLIEAACMKLDEINAVVRENGELKKQLEYSKEKLKSLDEENIKIKSIIFDRNVGSLATIEDELKVLAAKDDFYPESVLNVLKAYINDFKAYNQKADVLVTENESLRKQLAKLEGRIQITELPTKNDLLVTDVMQLQSMANDLRNEVVQLRDVEEDRAKLQVEFDKLKETIKGIGSPADLYKMKKNSAALHEVKCDRDKLRHLLNSMVGIEDEIRKLKERAEKTDLLEKELAAVQAGMGDTGVEGARAHDAMQREIEQLRKEKEEAQTKLESILLRGADACHMQDQLKDYDRVSCELHLYKIHYNELINELRRVSTRLFQLEPELEETRRRLNVAETAISSYERQMDELMEVIRELEEARCYQSEQEYIPSTTGLTQDGHVQDLLAVAKIIILFIQKETKARKNLEDELRACKKEIGQLSNIATSGKEAVNDRHDKELDVLRKQLEACHKAKESAEEETRTLLGQISNEDIEDLLDQLNACKRENQRLQASAGVSSPKDSKNFDDVFDALNKSRAQASTSNAERAQLNEKINEMQRLLDACKPENETFLVIEEKQVVLDSCQKRLAELEEQVARLTKELEDCLNKCANEMSSVKQQLADDRTSIKTQLEEVADKEDNDRADNIGKLIKCEEELAELKGEMMQYISKSKADNKEFQQHVDRLNTEKSNLDKTRALVSKEVGDLEKLLAECRNDNQKLQNERDRLVSQLKECHAEINEVREELNSKARDGEKEKAKLTDQLAKATGEVTRLNSALHMEQQGSKTLAEDYEKIKATLKQLTNKYNQLESRYDSLQQHDASIQKSLDDLRKEYEDKSLEWTKEINEQKGLLEQAKASLEAQRSEISRLNDVLKQGSCKDLEDQLSSIMAENNRLKSDNEKLKESVEAKERQIAGLQGKVEGIATDLNNYGQELQTIDCCVYIAEIDQLKNTISQHLEEIKNQANLLNNLKEEVNAAKASKAELEYELSKLKSDKEAANEQLKHLASKQQSEKSMLQTITTKDNADELKKCLAEKNLLQEENKRLQNEFKQLEHLVKDIEEERKKNKQLESMIEDFEEKINDIQNQPSTAAPVPDLHVENIVHKLKEQLQRETNKNNVLEAELQACKVSLADCRKQLHDFKAAIDDLQQQQNNYKQQLEISKNKLDTANLQLRGSKIEIASTSQLELASKIELEKCRAQLDEARGEISLLRVQRQTTTPSLKIHSGVNKAPAVIPINQTQSIPIQIAAESRGATNTVSADHPRPAGAITLPKPSDTVTASVIDKDLTSTIPSPEDSGPGSANIAPVNAQSVVPSPTAASTSSVSSLPAAATSETAATSRPVGPTTPAAPSSAAVAESAAAPTSTATASTSEAPLLVPTILNTFTGDKTSAMFASSINEIKSSHCENLEKMQKMYEERMQELMKDHEREIQSLRMTNESLRKMLEDIKAQITALGGTASVETKKDQSTKKKCDSIADICGVDRKLKKICKKIIKASIDCLSLRELKYLHCAVYRAGVKMKPVAKMASLDDINRCCECTGFICCLPSIPKDAEKKFVERINCLENELENANEVLKRLRERCESKSSCNRRCCTGHAERRTAPPRGINDAVNQILKCAREGRRNSDF